MDELNKVNNEKNDFIIPEGGNVTKEGVPIPNGFYYVGGEKSDGVVISDSQNDENKGAEHDKIQELEGNQFVWIPVIDLSTMFIEENNIKLQEVNVVTNVYSSLRVRELERGEEGVMFQPGKPGELIERKICEPDIALDYDTDSQFYKDMLGYESSDELAEALVNEYKEIYESIKKYKGFYVGRYELSGTSEKPTMKAGSVISEINWYEAKKACMNVIKENEAVKSTMIYGNQWDEIMNWLKNTKFKGQEEKVDEDSNDWGNYYDYTVSMENIKVAPTGSKEEWSANHLYDLAGNCYEWTQENSEFMLRVLRGRNV